MFTPFFGMTACAAILTSSCFLALADSPSESDPFCYEPLPQQLPAPPVVNRSSTARLASLQTQLAQLPTFAAFREMADIYGGLGRYQDAASVHRTQAKMYRSRQMDQAAIVEENLASRNDTHVSLFAERDFDGGDMEPTSQRAPLEPAVGCYAGAFIDSDDRLHEKFTDENYQTHQGAREFSRLVGKSPACLFTYLAYGQEVPVTWLLRCKEQGIIPQLAWEPQDLSSVQDNEYLRRFAQTLGDLRVPVFIRFACEMNGAWTPYHDDPKLYRQKFRLVHQVLKKWAPQAITIWCVNAIPAQNIDDYYPGDDCCDWVGVDLYSTPFLDNDPGRLAFADSPLTQLDPIYAKYASRKPIAICEYAASHQSKMDGLPREQYAVEKMSQLYGALPRLYPRVKMIDWFDMDGITHEKLNKPMDNYGLTNDETVLAAYRALIASPYFLAHEPTGDEASELKPLRSLDGQQLSGSVKVSLFVSCPTPRPKVYLLAGNCVVYSGRCFGAHQFALDTSRLRPGTTALTALVYDEKNNFLGSESARVNIMDAFAPASKTMLAEAPARPAEAPPTDVTLQLRSVRVQLLAMDADSPNRAQLLDITQQLARLSERIIPSTESRVRSEP